MDIYGYVDGYLWIKRWIALDTDWRSMDMLGISWQYP
jgi:hypothetical protein